LEVANRATAHLFIANPFKGKKMMKLFMTHPPIEERIKKLRNLDVN
jgi:heat shock protein HtpX